MTRIPPADLDHIFALTRELWPPISDERIFITGGTGFIGRWLLETLTAARDRLGLRTEAVVLTRNAAAFRDHAPHLAFHPAVRIHEGDVRSFDFPEGTFSHVIHAATDASATLNARCPAVIFDTIVDGTRRVLECARRAGARRLLFTSSGAVYGRQPAELAHVGEDYSGGPDPTVAASAYGEGKRAAELLCACHGAGFGVEAMLARCFAFVGPGLPLDAHYAIGNFIGDALRGGPIRVQGDGRPYRSYLYAADLAVWLWTILLRGRRGAYNVGSEDALTIRDLASRVAAVIAPSCAIDIEAPDASLGPAPRYVPSTRRAATELGLGCHIPLDEGIRRTAEWHRAQVTA